MLKMCRVCTVFYLQRVEIHWWITQSVYWVLLNLSFTADAYRGWNGVKERTWHVTRISVILGNFSFTFACVCVCVYCRVTVSYCDRYHSLKKHFREMPVYFFQICIASDIKATAVGLETCPCPSISD